MAVADRLADGGKTTASQRPTQRISDHMGEGDSLSFGPGLQRSRLEAEFPLDVIDDAAQAARRPQPAKVVEDAAGEVDEQRSLRPRRRAQGPGHRRSGFAYITKLAAGCSGHYSNASLSMRAKSPSWSARSASSRWKSTS